MIDFRNVNTLWSSILVETLQRLGLRIAVICPGSRSTPLTLAFASNHQIEAIPILDERSAAFFALGIAKRSGLPTVLICTSGTAGANFYPAMIEARESRIPLILLTADRPPELRDCHAGQAIDQVKFYGHYPNWQTELSIPSLERGLLNYLRQTLIYAWERSLFPTPGPIHLNIPFREPLTPLPDPNLEPLKQQFRSEDFFSEVLSDSLKPAPFFPFNNSSLVLPEWLSCSKGIIIAGPAQPLLSEAYCHAVSQLSQSLGYPVLAEGLSPLRNQIHLNPYLISAYDVILRNPALSQRLIPEVVIQLGDFPTSKELRNWIETLQPRRWIVDPSHHNFDPLHGKTIHLRGSVEQLVSQLIDIPLPTELPNEYLQLWCSAEAKIQQAIDRTMHSIDTLVEPKVAWVLSQSLPAETAIFIANSMPVRDVEFFWKPNRSKVKPFFSRGANGIDGTLSTALGIAHDGQPTVLLTGDLALLHDTNGFLMRNKFKGHLTILLINNNGGGIFEMLPIANFNPPFEEFFATPQNINFSQLCTTYGVEYELIESWPQLQQRLNPLPTTGIRVLEVPTNRRTDAAWRKRHLSQLAQL